MAGRVQLIQLARIYGRERDGFDEAAARAAIAGNTDALAEALFIEAAESDDVTSRETALTYVEGRLAFFAGLVGEAEADAIRAYVSERTVAWG